MQKNVSAGETIGSDAFLTRIVRQGRNYATFSSAGCSTARLTAARGSSSSSTTLSLLHLSSQGAAIYVIYWYGRQMEKAGLITVPLLHIQLN